MERSDGQQAITLSTVDEDLQKIWNDLTYE